jgi:hypothetical protein
MERGALSARMKCVSWYSSKLGSKLRKTSVKKAARTWGPHGEITARSRRGRGHGSQPRGVKAARTVQPGHDESTSTSTDGTMLSLPKTVRSKGW